MQIFCLIHVKQSIIGDFTKFLRLDKWKLSSISIEAEKCCYFSLKQRSRSDNPFRRSRAALLLFSEVEKQKRWSISKKQSSDATFHKWRSRSYANFQWSREAEKQRSTATFHWNGEAILFFTETEKCQYFSLNLLLTLWVNPPVPPSYIIDCVQFL